jgi:hypothetical protein
VLEVIHEDSVMGRVEVIWKRRVGGRKRIGVDCRSDVPGDWGWCVVWPGVGPLTHVKAI